jgi:hypothetical protein
VRYKRPVITASLVLATMFSLFVTTSFSLPLSGRVLDADTSNGVDGAVVVATWLIQLPINAASVGYVELQETRTGAHGEFQLAGWGPRFRTRGVNAPAQPEIRIIRQGYRPMHEFVDSGTLRQNGDVVFRMQKENGSLAEQAEILGSLGSTTFFEFFASASNCEWQRIPLYLQALREADLQLIRSGYATSLGPELSGKDSFGCVTWQP